MKGEIDKGAVGGGARLSLQSTRECLPSAAECTAFSGKTPQGGMTCEGTDGSTT